MIRRVPFCAKHYNTSRVKVHLHEIGCIDVVSAMGPCCQFVESDLEFSPRPWFFVDSHRTSLANNSITFIPTLILEPSFCDRWRPGGWGGYVFPHCLVISDRLPLYVHIFQESSTLLFPYYIMFSMTVYFSCLFPHFFSHSSLLSPSPFELPVSVCPSLILNYSISSSKGR